MTKKMEYNIILIWLFIVIPLNFLSYGSDPDSGTLAETANKIWQNKEYFKSRTSGFPLYEISISPLVASGKWYLSNLLSVIFGLSILLALLKLTNRKEFNHPLLVILSIVFAPIFIKNSTCTMDYMGALAFLSWSYVVMRQGKYFVAAILIGIASGFRPISGLFVIPLMIYAWSYRENYSYIIKMGLLALLIGIIAYSPVLLKYGFLGSAYIPTDLKSAILVGGYLFLNFFGIIASLVIFPSIIYIFYTYRKKLSPFILFHFTNIAIWIIMFAYMPYESEYLLPMLLSIVLLLDKHLEYRIFLLSTLLILSYHLVRFDLMAGSSGERYIKPAIKEGYLIGEIKHRIFQYSLRTIATNFQVTQPTILHFGDSFIPVTNDKWLYDEKLKAYKQKDGLLYITTESTGCKKHQEYYNSGYKNIVWNDMKSGIKKCHDKQKYYEIIYDLDNYFNAHISGKSNTSEY
jgi:uncharacterized membrane protein YciS (DUF1049 family)